MPQNSALHILPSASVLDRAEFVNQDADTMAGTITAITAEGKPLLVVPDANGFFSIKNLMVLLTNKDKNAQLIAEKLSTMEGKGMLAEYAQATPEPAPAPAQGYPFAPVPAGWSIAADWSLGPTKIRRKRPNSDGDGPQLVIATESLPKLWLIASRVWAGLNPFGTTCMIIVEDQLRKAAIHKTEIEVAGLTLRRYELEQIAKYRGWEFPEAN